MKELSHVIGNCSRRSAVKNGIELQRRVTEMLQCLMSPLYPSSAYNSRHQRSLHGCYARMLPACTSEFVESLLRKQSHPLLDSLPWKRLIQHHFKLLGRLALNAISHKDSLKGAAAHRLLDFIPHYSNIHLQFQSWSRIPLQLSLSPWPSWR